jgi:hypothetical protein
VGDKGKPGFRWLGPEGLQSLRPIATSHLAPPTAATAFHLPPGGFQAALAGDLPPLNMAGAVATGSMPEGHADATGAVQVSLPAPASLYVGGDAGGPAGMHAAAPAGSGGVKRPRRKSLRAREAEADTDEEGEEEGDYSDDGGDGSEEAKRIKGACVTAVAVLLGVLI